MEQQKDKTEIAVAVFDKHAASYNEKYGDVSLYHDSLDIFCSAVTASGARILELACGPGNISRYLLHRRPDFRLWGTDLSPNMLRLAQSNNPGAVFELMDCRDISRLNTLYDGIMCGFCLPYLSRDEAIQLIADAARLLAPGGALYISTMEDDYSHSGYTFSSAGDRIYTWYHQADYLLQALKDYGFTIILQDRKHYPVSDGSAVTDLILIAARCEQTCEAANQ